MDKLKDTLEQAKDKVEAAAHKADPAVDSWLKKLSDSPLTPLWMVVILVGILAVWVVLT